MGLEAAKRRTPSATLTASSLPEPQSPIVMSRVSVAGRVGSAPQAASAVVSALLERASAAARSSNSRRLSLPSRAARTRSKLSAPSWRLILLREYRSAQTQTSSSAGCELRPAARQHPDRRAHRRGAGRRSYRPCARRVSDPGLVAVGPTERRRMGRSGSCEHHDFACRDEPRPPVRRCAAAQSAASSAATAAGLDRGRLGRDP
jgi:hypothetical protein